MASPLHIALPVVPEARSEGAVVVRARFPMTACRPCKVRAQCTRSHNKSDTGRRIPLRPQAEYEAIQQARAREDTCQCIPPAFASGRWLSDRRGPVHAREQRPSPPPERTPARPAAASRDGRCHLRPRFLPQRRSDRRSSCQREHRAAGESRRAMSHVQVGGLPRGLHPVGYTTDLKIIAGACEEDVAGMGRCRDGSSVAGSTPHRPGAPGTLSVSRRDAFRALSSPIVSSDR